ncbi:MAG: prolyl oligopeptidase family serine peptidase [Raineya sp.]|nr:prolyl oligopeptidase family serine peptidase [Raineya sp.]
MMRLYVYFLLFCSFSMFAQQKISYPQTAKVNQIDEYFGVKVADPYRWLEVSDSVAVKEWIKAQNAVTFDYLAQIPYRNQIRKRLQEVWNFPKMGVPVSYGDFEILQKNDGLQNQFVFYIKRGNNQEELLLDPNAMDASGIVAVNTWAVSEDKRYFAFAWAKGGSDWNTIEIIDLQTKQKLTDRIEWVKFSGIAWYKNGFFYSRYDAPKAGKEYEAKNEFHKLYYHKIGTPQAQDELIFMDRKNPLQNVSASVSEKNDLLYVFLPKGTAGTAILYKKLTSFADLKPLIPHQESENQLITTLDNHAIIRTNFQAPRYRVVAIPLENPAVENWKTIIPETENVLTSVRYIGGYFVATYMQDASHKVWLYDKTGKKTNEIKLPSLGTVAGFTGKEEATFTYYTFSSFLQGGNIYKYDFTTHTSTLYFAPKIPFKAENYETKEVFYPSKDGKKVHLFITHKKGLKRNGKNPTYLYGYGGFNISINPSFDVRMIPFLEAGGIYAVANLRGGSEYGEEWHLDGARLKKQNVFNDFIAAAEFLIREKYTSAEKLAISGRSNGGLLVGACMTQRPELFAVALPGVGVMDMLRFHKFTIGWAWVPEYGSAEQSKEDFENLYKYSPLHNIKPTAYPATLVYTADKDDRVVPAHSFKFIATLQENQRGSKPTLIRIDVDAGHGAGKPIAKQIDEWTDIWAFTLWNLGIRKI